MVDWRDLASATDLRDDALLACDVAGLSVILLRVDGEARCFEDRCPHQDVRLSEFGAARRGMVLCHAHGARFRATDGRAVGGPTSCPLRSFPVRVSDGRVWVNVGGAARDNLKGDCCHV